MQLFAWSHDDYISSRCCYFNDLYTQGGMLGAQALEKMLKGILLLEKPTFNVKDLNHRIVDVQSEIQSLDLSSFTDTFLNYQEIFKARYPDNIKTTFRHSNVQIHKLDSAYWYIFSNLPLADEIKFTTKFSVNLFHEDRKDLKERYWVTINNQTLLAIYDDLKLKYDSVIKHLNKIS